MAKSKKEAPVGFDAELEALFGAGTLKPADTDGVELVKRVSSGSYSLNRATRDTLGNGGFPMGGKATCLIGPESSGKSTNLYYGIAEAQVLNYRCCLFDIEGSFDATYAISIGIDLSKLYMVDSKALLKVLGIKDRTVACGEEWSDFLVKVITSRKFQFIGFDSIAAMVPKVLLEGGSSAAKMSYFAAMMSKTYPLVNNALLGWDGALVCVNQWRANPGNVFEPLVPVGGNAWRYLWSLTIDIKKGHEKDDNEIIGAKISGKVIKSKVCRPQRKFSFVLRFGVGILQQLEYKEAAITYGIITKTGNTYVFGNDKLGIGEGQLDKRMIEDKELFQRIKTAVIDEDNSKLSTDNDLVEGEEPDVQGTEQEAEEQSPSGNVSIPVDESTKEELQNL